MILHKKLIKEVDDVVDCSTVLLELVQKSQEERIGVESSAHSAVPHRISLNFEMKGCHRDRDLKRVALPRRVRLLKKCPT